MSAHTPYRLIVLMLVSALVIGGGVSADASARTEAAPSVAKQKKKRNAVKCRKNQAPIKLKRRTVGCRSLRAALPAPREGDPRLLLAKTALDDDLAGVRDRRGRRAPSLKKLFRKVGPRAYRKLQGAIPQGLARLDQLANGSPAASRAGVIAARQLTKCAGGPPAPTKTDTYRSSSGGESMTAKVTLGAVGTLDLQLEGGGFTISVAITSDECSHFDAPACPTAAGVVDGRDSSTFKVSLTVAKGHSVLMSRSFDYSGQTTMHAEVDEHAKLKLIDIDDTRTANIELGGTRQEFGPVNLIYTGIHHARVDMPKGNYVPGLSAVDISLTARGVTVGRSDLGLTGNNIARDLDNDFATLVGTEISNFRSLEDAWLKAGACARLVFKPPSYDLGRLSKGQTGQLTVRVVSKLDGGTARPGDWTVVGVDNGTLTPASAAGEAPNFSWVVTKAGHGIKLKADVTATSTAGVASGTWEQETEDKPLYRGTVSGTRGDSLETAGECGGSWQFSYSARLASLDGSDQPFAVIIDTDSGPEGGDALGYDETGSGTWRLEPCNGSPGCSANLSFDPDFRSHGDVYFEADADTVRATVEVGPIENDCGSRGFTLGEGTFPRSTVGADTITVALSWNSGPVFGNGTLTLTRVN